MKKIAIIGTGIAGLSTLAAIERLHLQHDVHVVEPEPNCYDEARAAVDEIAEAIQYAALFPQKPRPKVWQAWLLLLALMTTTSCSGELDRVLFQDAQQTEQPGLPTDAGAAPEAAPVVAPAPAGMSGAEQRRYYQAQLDAQRAAQPRKMKNSNNQTVNQTVNTISTKMLIALAVTCFVAGGLATLLVQRLIRP